MAELSRRTEGAEKKIGVLSMGVLLDLGYVAAGAAVSPWLLWKAVFDERYRHRLGERFGALPQAGDRRPLWIHCASVGEVNLAKPIVARLAKSRPDLPVLITSVTRAGLENAEASFPSARTAYYPLDLSAVVHRALRRVDPVGVVLVELEVWPNFIRACGRRGVPVGVVNGRMSERSFGRYRALGGYFRPIFRRLAAAGMQNETYAGRLRELGADPVVTGNLKFDAAIGFDPETEGRAWRERLGLGDAPVLVAGSTHDPEERLAVEAFRSLRERIPNLRLVLAPRHLERLEEVQKVVEAADLRCYKRSLPLPDRTGNGVILLDTVGELSRLYAASTAVFIGGTFCSRGGQNMLEPAALGKPIVGGPSLTNFRDIAVALVEAGGMRVVERPEDLAGALEGFLADPAAAREAGARAREAVEAGRGAIEKTLDLIESKILKRET